jgi:hypothetical protein
MARKRLGEILLQLGLIDNDQLTSALAHQRQWGQRLGIVMVAKGFITEGMLAKVLGKSLGLPVVDLSQITIEPKATNMLSKNFCEDNDLIPVDIEQSRGSKTLLVAMADPMNMTVIDEIEFTSGLKVKPVLATISAISSAVQKIYYGKDVEIEPLVYSKKVDQESGLMELVRPGGEVERVDTNVSKKDGTSLKPKSPKETKTVGSQQIRNIDQQSIVKIEKYFWALMRVLAKKGVFTKEEFLDEIKDK